MTQQILSEISQCIVNGKNKRIAELVPQALASGIPPEEVLTKGLIPGMEIVSERFKGEEFYIPQVLLSERALNEAMAFITEKLAARGYKPRGTVVIGTVKEDLHDIGKNLVAAMLRGQGFKIVDLTTDVRPEQFLEAARANGAEVVGMSALLTTTMDNMRTTIDFLRRNGYRGKIIVGGAPVTQEFATHIQADLFAEDAASAVDIVKKALNVA
jgi:5-methyltetrahydrofolate--homocysteine methyltransferase